MNDIEVVYQARRIRLIGHHGQLSEEGTGVFSSYNKAFKYLREYGHELGVFLEINAYVVDGDTVEGPVRTWRFDENGEHHPLGFADEEDFVESTGKFKLGDIVRIRPRQEVGLESPCNSAELAVVTDDDTTVDEQEKLEGVQGVYTVHFVNPGNGFLWHFHVAEICLEPFHDALPGELRILSIISDHFRGVHPLQPDLIGRILDDPHTYMRNTATFDFEKRVFVAPAP